MSSIDATTSTNLTSFFQSELTIAQPSSLTSSLGGSVANTQTGATLLASTNGAIFQMAALMQRVRSLTNQASTLGTANTAGVDALRTQVNAALTQFNTISAASSVASGATATAAAGAATGAATAAAGAATVSKAPVSEWVSNFNTTYFSAPASASLDSASEVAGSTSSATGATGSPASGATAIAAAITGAAVSAAAVTPASLDELRTTLGTMQDNLHANIAKLGVSVQKALAYDSSISGTGSTAAAYGANTLSSLWASFASSTGSSYL